MQAVGAESTFTQDNGSVDEVFAQLTAERAAGLADEPQLRPEALISPGDTPAAATWRYEPAAAAAAVEEQHPSMADCMAAVEEPLMAKAEAVQVDEAPDAAMAAFDHTSLDTPAAAAVAGGSQTPHLADCVAAVEEPLTTAAEAVVLDEAPDTAMAAFDHTVVDTPAAAAVAGGNQSPNLADIALAVEPSSLPASLDESVGEDEEPDAALAAFDHMVPEHPRSEPTAAAAAAVPAADSAVDENGAEWDQSFLDPLQASGAVGSGSVDLADAAGVDAVAAAAAAATAAPTAAAPAAGQQAQQQPEKQAGGGDFGAVMQQWWESVMQMFEEWQRNLSGPK
jgi:hypothetical protein